jgi:hypothetical protein
MSKPVSQYTQQQKLDELWRRGVLVPWLCHEVQKKMHAGVLEARARKYVINSARRLGKSFYLCALAQERARQVPNSQIKYAAETQRSVKKIIVPLMRQIMDTCPRELRPRFKAHDGVYEFPNGSEIHIAGAAMDQADSLRGTACDLAIVDEAGFIDSQQLEYLVESILFPQTLTRPNAMIVMGSTPPNSPDHTFVQKYMAQAIAAGAYSRYTIYDNPLITPEIIEEFKREAGGEDSTTWRREYLAEVVTDTDSAIFPEVAAGPLLDQLCYDIPRPPFYFPITAVDLGYVDYTGVLFGYYHFPLAKIVIEDELLLNKTTSAEIVRQILAKERDLWGPNTPRMRVVDGPALVVADLNQTHRFGCRTPEKTDLAANINRVRIDLSEQRVIFHPRCTNTISQVRFATWDNQRKSFARNSFGGHFDLVAALIYLAKHIDRVSNPIPPGWGWDQFNDFGFARSAKNTAITTLKHLFPRLTPSRNEF